MKIKTIWFVTTLILITTIIININIKKEENDFKPIDLNIGDEFTKVEYKNKMYVINYMVEEITGDEQKDMVILIAEKSGENSAIYKNVDLILFDTANEIFYNANLKKLEGESPKILISDLTDDGRNDIIISLENKNKEKDVRIITMKKDNLEEIFGQKENKKVRFQGEIIDGVKAYIKCSKLKQELYLNLNSQKEELITNKIIDESGKVISENNKVNTTAFKTVDVIGINDKNGIQTTQLIVALESQKIIDEITIIWKYENNKWQIKEAKLASGVFIVGYN